MCGALGKCNTWGDISINLCISLGSFKIDTLLFGDLLEAGPLPFRQPAFMVGLGSWIFRVKVLGILYLSLSLASWHEYFCTSLSFLNNILHLLFFTLFWHTIFNEASDIFIFIRLILISDFRNKGLSQLLLNLRRLLHITWVNQKREVPSLYCDIFLVMFVKRF